MSPRVERWRGACPGCGGFWNPVIRRASESSFPGAETVEVEDGELIGVSDAAADVKEPPRMVIGGEFSGVDTVLGGGVVAGSVVVISGEGGIGKSTLIMQCLRLLARRQRIVYITGEESVRQVALRTKRIGRFNRQLQMMRQVDLESILETLRDHRPQVAVIDSMQTLVCLNPVNDQPLIPGSTLAVRVATQVLGAFAQKEDIAFIIVSHVTKDGDLAGPSAFRHGVDALLHLERSSVDGTVCELRPNNKNRHGSTGPDVVARFKMGQRGMVPIFSKEEKAARAAKPPAAAKKLLKTLRRSLKLVPPPKTPGGAPDPVARR